MKTIFTILCAALLLGCSSDDDGNKPQACNGRFYNAATGETIIAYTDADRTPPAEGFVFIECTDGQPDY